MIRVKFSLSEADEEGDSDAFLIENIKDWFGLETDYGWPFFFGIDGCESGDDETDQSASESDGDDDKLRYDILYGSLAHCGLVTTYGDVAPGQHWLK